MKKIKNFISIVLLIVAISIVALLIYDVLNVLSERVNIKMVDASYEDLYFKVASNYKYEQKRGLSSVTYSTSTNIGCSLSVEKNTKWEFYNPNTYELDNESYKIEDLYSSNVKLIPKMINGKEWYYHETDDNGDYFNKIYYYDYIIKNVHYRVTIYSKNDDLCHVNDIANSLEVHL